jgi:hypothetical protein
VNAPPPEPPPPTLLPPGARPGFLGPLAVPGDLWWVCIEPTPLAGMAYPRTGAWDELAARGFGHVIDLTRDASKYDPSPLVSHASKLSDLIVRRRPPDAARDEARIATAAALVADRWRAGEGVVVHCLGGRGRTGAVIGSALVRLGHEPDAVVDWLHRVQRTRGRRGWPEQQWQAEVVGRALRGQQGP